MFIFSEFMGPLVGGVLNTYLSFSTCTLIFGEIILTQVQLAHSQYNIIPILSSNVVILCLENDNDLFH